jgi:uncharacterized OB-fold protein
MSERPFTSASFNQYLSEERLMGSTCQACGAIYLPPRPLCAACHGDEMAWVDMEGRGRLVAYTTVHIGPGIMIAEGYDRNNPYCTGIVELAEGPRISARIVGVDAHSPAGIQIGTPLMVHFLPAQQTEEQRTFLAFKPVGPST